MDMTKFGIVELGFDCRKCGVHLYFSSPWDVLQAIDLTCAKCETRYITQIIKVPASK